MLIVSHLKNKDLVIVDTSISVNKLDSVLKIIIYFGCSYIKSKDVYSLQG